MSHLIVEVCKVQELTKHPNADTLLIAKIKDWHCIVKDDGAIKNGDLVVYIPIDSIIPDELAEKYNLEYLKKGSRVRTVKLRGYISQGLVLPLDCLPEGNWKDGDNVAEVLGITKWEPPTPAWQQPINTGKRKRGSLNNPNPEFYKYTDIDNIKNFPGVFDEDDEVVITEKIHGTNFRVTYVKRYTKGLINKILSWFQSPYQFLVGSRNVQIGEGRECAFYGTDVYSKIAKKYSLYDIMKEHPGYELFGEIYGVDSDTGVKIQDLTYGKDQLDVVFFDLMIDGKYVTYDEFMNFCNEHNLPTVPLLFRGTFTHEVLESCTSGDSVLAKINGSKQIREGAVVKDPNETNHPRIGRKILKSISVDYLLRKDGTENH